MTDRLTVIAAAMQMEASANPCTDRYSRNGHTKDTIDDGWPSNQLFGKPNGCAKYSVTACENKSIVLHLVGPSSLVPRDPPASWMVPCD